MTAIVLVSVINHYHINGLHLFRDTLYRNTQGMFKKPVFTKIEMFEVIVKLHYCNLMSSMFPILTFLFCLQNVYVIAMNILNQLLWNKV